MFDNEQSIAVGFPGKNLNNFLIKDYEDLMKKLHKELEEEHKKILMQCEERVQESLGIKKKKDEQKGKQYYKEVITQFLFKMEVMSDGELYLIVPTNHE